MSSSRTNAVRRTILAISVLISALFMAAEATADSYATETLSEDIASSDLVVFCRLVERSPTAHDDGDCTFEIFEILKGAEHLPAATGAGNPYRVKMLYFGNGPIGKSFFSFGFGTKSISWGTPWSVSGESMQYLRDLMKLPARGLARYRELYRHLEDPDVMIARDAYQEFENFSYPQLRETRDLMPREHLLRWIADANTPISRRKQYLRMLGVCGTTADVPTLRAYLDHTDIKMRAAFDDAIVSYLVLGRESCLPIIEEKFLKNPVLEFMDQHAALVAIRFVGANSAILSRRQQIEAFRLLLDRPEFADLVIRDLQNLDDWESLPRIVQLFRDAHHTSTMYVRLPAVNFVRACPLPEAKHYLAELRALDPEIVAKSFQHFPNKPTLPMQTSVGCNRSNHSPRRGRTIRFGCRVPFFERIRSTRPCVRVF